MQTKEILITLTSADVELALGMIRTMKVKGYTFEVYFQTLEDKLQVLRRRLHGTTLLSQMYFNSHECTIMQRCNIHYVDDLVKQLDKLFLLGSKREAIQRTFERATRLHIIFHSSTK